jgi:hypothetical protein
MPLSVCARRHLGPTMTLLSELRADRACGCMQGTPVPMQRDVRLGLRNDRSCRCQGPSCPDERSWSRWRSRGFERLHIPNAGAQLLTRIDTHVDGGAPARSVPACDDVTESDAELDVAILVPRSNAQVSFE